MQNTKLKHILDRELYTCQNAAQIQLKDNVIPTCIIHIFVLRIRTVFYIHYVLKHFRLS